MRASLLLALLAVFAPLSLATIGGGQSVVSEIHRQTVLQYGWLTEQQFLYAFAISRLSPGPGSLLVALIGWDVAGWAGAVVAAAAIFVPSSLLVYGLAHVWSRYRGRPWLVAIERGLGPVAAGLILAASLTVLEAAEGGWMAWAVAAAAAIWLYFTRTTPFLVLAVGAGIFILTT